MTVDIRNLILVICLTLCNSQLKAQWVQTSGPNQGSVISVTGFGGYIVAGTYGGGIFLSADNGANWCVANAGLGCKYVRVLAATGSTLFAGTSDGGVFVSADSGKTWREANTGLSEWDSRITALAVSGKNLFAGTFGNGVFRSADNGARWTQVLTRQYVGSLAVSGHYLFAGGYGTVYLSADDGEGWGALGAGLTDLRVSTLAACGTTFLAGTDNRGIFRFTDSSTTWEAVFDGMTNYQINAITVSDSNLFAGTEGGVYLSTDFGTTWCAVNAGFTQTSVQALAVSGEYLFAGTKNGAVWRRPLSELLTSVERWAALAPASISLCQNFPNPFNPSTTIRYGLPKRSMIKLSIFNILGQEVEILQEGEEESGIHEAIFDAKALTSGVYFYRIQAGTSMQTKKLLLMR